jgi:hypothetical protein
MSNVYSYRGNLYTASSGVYNSDMSIKGQFTTTEPLEPNTSYDKHHFLDDSNFTFSFSDGYNTYSKNDPHTYITEHEGFDFTITTGEDAMPKFWFIYLSYLALSGEETSSRMHTGKDENLASFDFAKAKRLIGEDSEEIGSGEVGFKQSWTMNSVPSPPNNVRVL